MRAVTVIVLTLALSQAAYAINFNVEAGRKDCFWDEQTEHMPVSGSFQVTAGGFLDIDVTIYEPDGRLIFEATRESEGKFAYVSSTSGLFKFCFSNEMSTMTSKSVNFQIIHGHEINSPAKAQHLNAIEQSVVKLTDQSNNLMSELKYFRARERAHRNTTESTNARVLWWSFFEAACLVSMSMWQIYYLRRFFEVKRVV
eukprot:TRINITY_DN4243_c0_g1_i2.p1 TRINITY_DN4243_c0_g1~~TRINITY_DN4243_c0_g1_i2.p1  ORF type:complete len:199 (-),score=57.39 TRINITY_DN4243_c0_g1_i2:123-719(-)